MITNKDIRVENGSLIINGDPYPLDGQSPETIMQIVKDNSDTTPTENSTAPITSGGVFEANNDMIADFAVKTWTPQIYDLNTYKRDAPAQKYVKIGGLYVMFMEGTFDFSGISTMLQIRNLPCNICAGGTLYFGGFTAAAENTKGNRVQGDGNVVYPRPNVISTDFGNPSSAVTNEFVFFGYDS